MVKVRVNSSAKLHEFESRKQAFDWIKEKFKSNLVFSLLSYEDGKLEVMDRYFYTDGSFSKENVSY